MSHSRCSYAVNAAYEQEIRNIIKESEWEDEETASAGSEGNVLFNYSVNPNDRSRLKSPGL